MSGTIWIVLEDGRIMTMHGAESDFYTEGCDAAIDYTLFDRFCEEIDGGQMDYCSEEKQYGHIRDVSTYSRFRILYVTFSVEQKRAPCFSP